jgi:hypothetical protein
MIEAIIGGRVAARTLAKWANLTRRLRDKADSEYGLLGLMPFGVLLEATRNPANKVAANPGHLGPGSLSAVGFRSLVGSTRVTTLADPEKYSDMIEPVCWAAPTAFRFSTNWIRSRY